MPTTKKCPDCGEVKAEGDFSKTQWKKKQGSGRCAGCVGRDPLGEGQRRGTMQEERKSDQDTSESQQSKRQKTENNSSEIAQLRAYVEKKNAEQEKKNAELEAKSAELEAKSAELEAKIIRGISHKGVTTQAQFYDGLRKDRLCQLQDSPVWNKQGEWPGPGEIPDFSKEKDTSEAELQQRVTKILQELLLEHAETEKYQSVPNPNTFKEVSFRTRRPDIVNHVKGQTGSLAITSFGDLKKSGTGDFSSDEKGHILDMARSFLVNVGLCRSHVIVFLSDGHRWQFFRVERSDVVVAPDDLRYWESPVLKGSDGWLHYIGLLKADPADVGHVGPSLEGITLLEPLGRGGSALVYLGKEQQTETDVLVKLYFGDRRSSLDAEEEALSQLAKDRQLDDYVPRIRNIVPLSLPPPGVHSKALVVTPVGKDFRRHGDKEYVRGTHLEELVTIVRLAHESDLIHRDIKPDNVYLHPETSTILLSDWGSAVKRESNEDVTWEGTFGFSVSKSEEKYNKLSPQARDLVSVVRTAYCMLFQESDPGRTEAGAIEFWDQRIQKGTVWEDARGFAEAGNYRELGKLLRRLK